MNTTAAVKAPRGVSGAARLAFLELTPEQQDVYRIQFDRFGRPAWMCLRKALANDSGF